MCERVRSWSGRAMGLALMAIVSGGCAGEAEEPARVLIVEPTDGATIQGDTVRARLSASGVTIAPATGEAIGGEAHHHLFLNRDVSPAGEPIPDETEVVGLKHLGTGDSAWTFRDLEPGEHRVIAVLADGEHVPLQPWATDTVEFRLSNVE